MKVSSPVGDFPFEVKRLRVRSDGLHVEGSMGAWPSRVVIGVRDVPSLLQAGATPIVAGVAAVALSRSLVRRARRAQPRR
jgi:hypothetical protein